MRAVVHRFGPATGALVLGTMALWVSLLVVSPQPFMIDMSLRPNRPPALCGRPDDARSTGNDATLFTGALHRAIFWRTIVYYSTQEVESPTAAIFVLGLIIPFRVYEILRRREAGQRAALAG